MSSVTCEQVVAVASDFLDDALDSTESTLKHMKMPLSYFSLATQAR